MCLPSSLLTCPPPPSGLGLQCDAVDYLLNPQHLLPWTVGDLRAAGLALQRAHLVEAADKYAMAMKVTGEEEAEEQIDR